ncbi:hypothetical protein, partial [Arenimonas caeni]|uniref:hypothetical protein n=1 Tax=Arenimonas caeni TaxID=2058085 RepID=UPI002A3599B9
MSERITRKPRFFRSLRRPRLVAAWLATLGLLLAAAIAHAGEEPEGLVFEHEGRWVASLAMDTTVHMQVHGLLAEVSVRQTYRNDSSQWREGRYLLPLP